MSSRNKIFFIDPRGNFDFNDVDVMERHNQYLDDYEKKFMENLEILILGVATNTVSKRVQGFKLSRKTRNAFYFGILAAKALREHKSPVLIASDPWFSFLTCLVIRRFVKKESRIQIQLHGQYISGDQKTLRNEFVKHYILWCIKQSDHTRFVNSIEYEFFIQSKQQIQNKIFLAPVPLNRIFLENLPKLSALKPLSVGFVGRLQSERGTSIFLELVKKLHKAIPGLKVIVIGAGPDQELIKNDLSENLPLDFTMLGYLPPVELRLEMEKIGVLLSCAPRESYGRSMREAILTGVPVLAIHSDGASLLQKSLPGSCIQVFEKQEPFNQILEKFGILLHSSYSPVELSEKLIIEYHGTSKLLESWHQLIHQGLRGQ
jgi:glycosyltransferase involved in cell wall biosynthesis